MQLCRAKKEVDTSGVGQLQRLPSHSETPDEQGGTPTVHRGGSSQPDHRNGSQPRSAADSVTVGLLQRLLRHLLNPAQSWPALGGCRWLRQQQCQLDGCRQPFQHLQSVSSVWCAHQRQKFSRTCREVADDQPRHTPSSREVRESNALPLFGHSF